jgi:arylsulfatase A-like enzyme
MQPIGALIHLAFLLWSTGFAVAEKPNIIVILADDMGYADAGFNGGQDIRTPHLDAIAKGGAVLKACYAQPVCSPTRSALMTGRYPFRTGIYTVIRPHAPWGLKLGEFTLPQALKSAGYETAIAGKWHLGEFEDAYKPTRRGFDHQYGMYFGMIDHFTHLRGPLFDWQRDDRPCHDEGYSTHLIAREACRMIREKKADRPLFLYLPFSAVHTPIQAPEKYSEPYHHLKPLRRTYAGMLAAMDEAIGQVVATLDEMKLRDNTLIIFSSDNGGFNPGAITSNIPLRGGKSSLFEGGIRVCACANWPGRIPAGQMIDEAIHVVDWYPTLVKLTGAIHPDGLPLDGKDILPLLAEGAKSPHDAISVSGIKRSDAAIRAGNWKLIVTTQPKGPPRFQLYNLSDDVGETRDLALTEPEKLRCLLERYAAIMKSAEPSGEVEGGLKE